MFYAVDRTTNKIVEGEDVIRWSTHTHTHTHTQHTHIQNTHTHNTHNTHTHTHAHIHTYTHQKGFLLSLYRALGNKLIQLDAILNDGCKVQSAQVPDLWMFLT